MKELVIIPAYNRVEFMILCLENILLAEGPVPNILVVVDNHQGAPPSPEVIDWLKNITQVHANVEYQVLQPHPYPGLSYAIMNGMNLALHHPVQPEHIYYIEDDVMIARDFFKWHRAMRQQGAFFVQVACKNHCTENKIPSKKDPELFYTTAFDYTALGACFSKNSICHILQHANPNYWKDTTAYVKKRFPKSVINPMYSEQAGLIRRVMEEQPRFVSAWPFHPRGFHLGWYGKNCKGNPIPGDTVEERVEALRSFMFDKKKLNEMAISHKFMDPVSLDPKPWTELRKQDHYEPARK